MIYLKKTLVCIIFFSTISSLCTIAQVGLNTDKPVSDLDIIASSSKQYDTIFNIKDYLDNSLLHINNAGRLSVNTKDYPVKIDLRNDNPDDLDHSLGIGYTDSEAATSRQGSVRYNPSVKTLEFSNGNSWVTLSPYKKRVFVLAQNETQRKFISSAGSLLRTLPEWDTITDEMGCFDGESFTAPREGMYAISATIVLKNMQPKTSDPLKYDLIIENSMSGDALRSTRSYYGGTGNSYLANVCKTLFYLDKDDIVSVSISLDNVLGYAQLVQDKSLNTLTIVEM